MCLRTVRPSGIAKPGKRTYSSEDEEITWKQPRAQAQYGKVCAGKGRNEALGNRSVVRYVGKGNRRWFGQESGKTSMLRLHAPAKRGHFLSLQHAVPSPFLMRIEVTDRTIPNHQMVCQGQSWQNSRSSRAISHCHFGI